MARPRKEVSEHTRSRVLEAADALLHLHGYIGVSMDAIAAHISIRKASLYHHFPDGKDQIMLEIGERLVATYSTGFQNAIGTGRTTRERLEIMATFTFDDTNQSGKVLRDTMRFMLPQHRQRLEQLFFTQIFAKVHEVIETAMTNQELRVHDTRFSAFSFLSLLSEMNAPEHRTTWPDLPQRVTDLLLGGLLTENSRQTSPN